MDSTSFATVFTPETPGVPRSGLRFSMNWTEGFREDLRSSMTWTEVFDELCRGIPRAGLRCSTSRNEVFRELD